MHILRYFSFNKFLPVEEMHQEVGTLFNVFNTDRYTLFSRKVVANHKNSQFLGWDESCQKVNTIPAHFCISRL